MAGTRSSARLSSSQNSSPPKAQQKSANAGQKRKAPPANSPSAKRGKKGEQQTIEQTLPTEDDSKDDVKDNAEGDSKDDTKEGSKDALKDEPNNEPVEDAEMIEAAEQAESENSKQKEDSKPEANGSNDDSGKDSAPSKDDVEKNDVQAPKDTTSMDYTGKLEKNNAAKEEKDSAANATDGAVEVDKERKDAQPSNMLEKGIIYFFVRGRVGTDNPESVQDIARSYIVLRPLPDGAKLGEGAIDEMKNCRLCALPKKVLPKSPRDRFMSFVEKAGTSVEELKAEFMQGSDYSTKTTGTSHTPPVTPVGEGVYAITTQGRDSHLVYMLTIPDKVGEVQDDIGLASKGSFVLSAKNPSATGPANANLPQGPEFPKEILDEFRGLRWMGLQPKHLDYPNAQFLIIGESAGELGHAADATSKDEKHDDKTTPVEEMEKLEDEDQFRAEALKDDNAVFADLEISHKDYPKLQTTW